MSRQSPITHCLLIAGIVGAAGSGALLTSRAYAQAKGAAPKSAPAKPAKAAAPAEPQKLQFGDTVITCDQLEYDLEKKQYVFTSPSKVELVSGNSRMTAPKMTVKLSPDNELASARCEGGVWIEKKDPEAGTVMTADSKELDYFEIEQKANLEGDVILRQDSPRLAKPMVVTGNRVEMDLKAKKNVIHRGPAAQARAQVQPKGKEGQPPAESVDLVADRIDVNSETQEYVATGKPVMIRPSTRLQAKRLRFTVDPKANDVTVAYADGDVTFDNKNAKGSTLHATADDGTYNKEISEVKLIGNVHAETKEPDAEKPTIYECGEFFYNTTTGYQRMSKNVKVILPEKPKPKTDDPKGTKPATEKAGEKPVDKSDEKK
jgi:lipopolysaccharide transport protein LptA